MKIIKPTSVVTAVLTLLTGIAAAVHFAARTDVPEGMLRVECGSLRLVVFCGENSRRNVSNVKLEAVS